MIAIIAAYAKNRCIGRDGRIPWYIPGEQRRFRRLTMGQAVILGRISYEEIGRPLPGRRTIVLSRRQDYAAEGCLVAHSLAEALALAGDADAFIAGGAALYAEALPLAQRLYLTEIDAELDGDRFFPTFDASKYRCTQEERVEGAIPYTCFCYVRTDASQ